MIGPLEVRRSKTSQNIPLEHQLYYDNQKGPNENS